MITEIIVEQQRLDLFEDLGAELNCAIDDIKDFSTRNTNYSKTINVPGNANNNKIFGHIYNFTSSNISTTDINGNTINVNNNFDPTRQANCQIFVNKIQVFKGVLRLLEITIQNGVIEYQCVVFGELGGFASAIGNELLEDMDNFNVYNQQWNKNSPMQSHNNSSVSGKINPQNSNAALHTRGSSSGKAFDPFDNIAGLNNNVPLNVQNRSNINPQQQYQQQQRSVMLNNNNIKKF
jgi:hypothetical protein